MPKPQRAPTLKELNEMAYPACVQLGSSGYRVFLREGRDPVLLFAPPPGLTREEQRRTALPALLDALEAKGSIGAARHDLER